MEYVHHRNNNQLQEIRVSDYHDLQLSIDKNDDNKHTLISTLGKKKSITLILIPQLTIKFGYILLLAIYFVYDEHLKAMASE